MQKQSARQVWDDEQIARAVGYTTTRFMGRGDFDTRAFARLPDALADARGDRRAIVYAITPEGWTIHIINGDQIAETETAMTTETNIDLKALDAALEATLPAKAPLTAAAEGINALVELEANLAAQAPKPRKGKAAKGKAPAEKPAKAPKAPKAPKAAAEPKAPAEPKAKPLSKRAQAAADALAGAEAGKLPEVPDFSAPTHNSYRKKLMGLVDAAKAGNLAHLEADTTEPKCSSRIPLCRYRDLAIIAVRAKLAKKAAKA
jgi:hypothetical protein